jgi:hypothetical protein
MKKNCSILPDYYAVIRSFSSAAGQSFYLSLSQEMYCKPFTFRVSERPIEMPASINHHLLHSFGAPDFSLGLTSKLVPAVHPHGNCAENPFF